MRGHLSRVWMNEQVSINPNRTNEKKNQNTNSRKDEIQDFYHRELSYSIQENNLHKRSPYVYHKALSWYRPFSRQSTNLGPQQEAVIKYRLPEPHSTPNDECLASISESVNECFYVCSFIHSRNINWAVVIYARHCSGP